MTDAMDVNASGEEAVPETNRWGTRFLRPEAEAAYWAWSHRRAVPVVRARAVVSAVAWAGIAGLAAVAGPAGLAAWLPGFALVAASLVAIDWAARRGSPQLAGLAVLVGNALTGLVAVGLANVYLDQHALGFGTTLMACFFQLTSSRERPLFSALSVMPYLGLEELLLVSGYRDGTLAWSALAFESWVMGTTLFLAVMVATVADRAQRASYQQERIIEAQKLTIARERARSEALLKQELSHQVAERSRELGAVLAKSDVTLDVRRLSPGERFDARYRIVSSLGAGGMGAVYEVERLTDGATLALKAVVGEVSGASAARFAREAEIGARVHHPNLVSIVDVGVSAGVPFLVMELVRGGSLEGQRARFGDVPWALPILKQIAEGLAALHDAGVVHRDLKPANVLLTGDPTNEGGSATVAKISDFGISRFGALDDAASSIDPNAATIGPSAAPRAGAHALTGTGMVMGTPLYMAPEAARGGRNVDAPADVFALGIIAYEMLTGRAPFAVPAVMLAMAEQPIPAPAAIDDARAPAPLRALVLDCLSGDPAKRPRVRKLVAEALS